MKVLLESLLLASLCTISSWSASPSKTPLLTQSPDVTVTEGETVNITCCLFNARSARLRLTWLKNQTEIHNFVFEANRSRNCSTLTFTNVTKKDSGRYICSVTIETPNFIPWEKGNGTVVTVTHGERDGPSSHPALSHIIYIAIALTVGLLLVFITLGCCCARRVRHARAARVIYEVPHIDSDVVDMDKRSTGSSTGSSQWCQVQVYESIDYFERLQNKEGR